MSTQEKLPELKEAAQMAVRAAKKAGADAVEVIASEGKELSVTVRLGEVEVLQEAGSSALGLRVFVDRKEAITYTSDTRPEALALLAEESVAMAKLSEPDEHNTLPDGFADPREIQDLDLFDPRIEEIDAKHAILVATACEKAAQGADERITNSEGATYGRGASAVVFANSSDFVAGYATSSCSFYTQPICDDADGKKRRAFWWTSSRHADGLQDPESVGREAAARAVAQIGASKLATAEMPIVFDPDAGRSILGTLAGIVNGAAFYRNSSYLIGKEGEQVASELVTVDDDPLHVRGPGSRPFDGDGLATRKNAVIDRGVLKTVLCDTYSARRLGRASTGSAGRGVGSGPSPTTSNFRLEPGTKSRDEVLADTGQGFYVTGMMGFGFNAVTGDFSRGASGFLIENGKLGRPISEVTISANFDDMLKRIDLIGADIDERSSMMVPTLRVSRMMVAGN